MFGLRTAKLRFERQHPLITILLFPMVHVGEARFYREVFAQAARCDVILIEGIRSSIGSNLTRSYRWMKPRRLGLVTQPDLTSEMAGQSKLVHADLPPDEFHREWKRIKLPLRLGFLLLSPLYGLWQRFFASRESLAKALSLDNLRSSDEVLNWNPDFEAVGRSLGEARDERLVLVLEGEIEAAGSGGKSIAIIYGAQHMRAIVRYLNKQGFRSGKGEWMVVFGF